MYTIRLFLDKRRPTKKGYPVKVRIYTKDFDYTRGTGLYQNYQTLKRTQEVISVDKEYQRRADYCNEMELSSQEAKKIFANGFVEETELDKLKRKVALLEKRQAQPVIPFIQGFMERKERIGNSTKHYQELISEVRKFKADLDFNEITYKLLRDYENYKRCTTKTNGSVIYKTIRTLKTVYNEAKKLGHIRDTSINPFEGLSIKIDRPRKPKVLLVSDLRKLEDFQPKSGTTNKNKLNLQRALAIFKFQVLIGGHDLVDIANLRWEDLERESGLPRIRFSRFKLRNNPSPVEVSNRLFDESLAIMNTYGTPDQARIFSWLGDPLSETYRKQRNYQGKTLKRISDTLGFERLTTKAPRYIFRTIAGKLNTSEVLLQQIMGHTPVGVTYRYQGKLDFEDQDKAHKNIIDFIYKEEGRVNKAEMEIILGELPLFWDSELYNDPSPDFNPNVYLDPSEQ